MAYALMSKAHEAILLSNICEFADKLENLSKVLDKMIEANVIYRNEKDEILLKGTKYDKNSEFVRTLIKKEDKAFDVFLAILIDTNQKGLAELLAPGQTGENNASASTTGREALKRQACPPAEGGTMAKRKPLENQEELDGHYEDSGLGAVTMAASSSAQVPDKEKESLRKHQSEVSLKMTSLIVIVDGLHGLKVLSDNDKGEIMAGITSYQNNSALVTSLMKKAQKGFPAFVRLLKETDQGELAELLTREIPGYSEGPQLAVAPSSSQVVSVAAHGYEGADVLDGGDEVKVKPCDPVFYDDHCDEAYPMDKRTRGKVCIVNVFKCGDLDARRGTYVDCKKLKDLFEQLHLHVTVYDDVNGLKAEDIKEKIREFAKAKNHKNAQCCVLVLLSHGQESNDGSNIFGTDGIPVSVGQLRQHVLDCGTLKGKPKLVLVQACRGSVPDQLPQTTDEVVCYATQKGDLSWRNRVNGSRFIKAVVEIFAENARDKDVAKMLEMVRLHVIRTSPLGQDQEPDIAVNTLDPAKKWYLFPNCP